MNHQAVMSKELSAIGPYSHGIACGDLLFLSGQIPIDSAVGQLVAGDIREQTRQCFQNAQSVLTAAGCCLQDVVKVTVFLTDMADFQAVNEVYAQHFEEPYPARSAIQVAALPMGARVEIEMIASRK